MPSFGDPRALKRNLTPTLALVAFLGSIGSMSQSFDLAWWSSIIGTPFFAETFGTSKLEVAANEFIPWLSASQQSTVSAAGQAALAVGAFSGGYLIERFGFKKGLYTQAVCVIIGSILEITGKLPGHSGKWAMMVLGKVVVCYACGLVAMGIPPYLAECSPAAIRGAAVSMFIITQGLGGIIASVVIYKVAYLTSPLAWQIPIAVQFAGPVMVLIATPFLPDSPRWLIEKGRIDDARMSLAYLRKGTNGYDVGLEIQDLQDAYNRKSMIRAKSKWGDILRGSNLRRTFIIVGMEALQTSAGIAFLGAYCTILMIELGIPNPFRISIYISCLGFGVSPLSFITQDYFGRRFLLLVGGTLQALLMIAFAAIYTAHPTLPGGYATTCVVCILLWIGVYSLSWASVPWTLMAELPSELCREKTVAVGAFFQYTASMLVGIINPYLQTNLGLNAKVGYIYGSVSVIAVAFTFFLIPETRGRSLEDIDRLFDLKVSVFEFGRYQLEDLPMSAISVPSSADGEKGDDLGVNLKEDMLHVEH